MGIRIAGQHRWRLLAAWCACSAVGLSLEAAEAAGSWDLLQEHPCPGPRVEVALKDPAGERLLGYLLAFQGGRLQLRTLDGQPDRDFSAGQIDSLRFLPLPRPPAHASDSTAHPPTPAEKGGALGRGEKDPERSRPPPHDGLTADGRKRPRERMKDFMDWTVLSKLTEPEREQFKELAGRHPFKLTPAEAQELRDLRLKQGLAEPEVYRRALEEVRKAQQTGKLEAYAELARKGMCQAVNFEECRKHAIALMVYWRTREAGLPLDLLAKMEKETGKIADPELREQLRTGLRSLSGDFYVQCLRFEMQDRDNPDALRPMRPKKE